MESGKQGEVTISSLDNDCLARIFDSFIGKERASQLALVCKLWNEVERTSYQPLELHLDHPDVLPSKMAWLLRDTNRLQAVTMPQLEQEASQSVPAEDFWDGMEGLLHHLAIRAPKMRILDLMLTKSRLSLLLISHPHFLVFPLLGRLTQLQSLTLRDWEPQIDDRAFVSHLTKLHNLEIFHLSNFWWQCKWYDGDDANEYNKACQQLQKAISELPALTCLHVKSVECKSLLHDVGFLTNLRELTVEDLCTRNDAPTPFEVTKLTRLTKLAYCLDECLGSQNLESLSGLRDLTLEGFTAMNSPENFLLSGAFALTRLALRRIHVNDVRSLLPMQALQSIKQLELTFHVACDEPFAPIWPTPWINLTSLEIHAMSHFWEGVPDRCMLPPLEPLKAFLSLKTVRQLILKLTMTSIASLRQNVSDSLHAFVGMSLNVQIAIIKGRLREEQQPLQKLNEVIYELCAEFCQKLPGMQYTCTPPEVVAMPCAMGGLEHIITRLTIRLAG